MDMEKVKAELDEIVEQCRGMDYIGFSTITEHCQNILALLKEQEEQIKNRDESLEKAREEIKWLRGMLKEQENASKRNPVIVCPHCGKRVK